MALRQSLDGPRQRRHRYEPRVAYQLAERAKRQGIQLSAARGPWQARRLPLGRRGRNQLHYIPFVTNGSAEVMVDTMEHAIDLSGFLNWCGVEDLNPVSDLELPADLVDKQGGARQAAGHDEVSGGET
jgi:hypothetical protein